MARTKQTARLLPRRSTASIKLMLPKKRKANHPEPLEDLFKKKEVISLISSDEEGVPESNDNQDNQNTEKKVSPADDDGSDLEYLSATSSVGSLISLTDLK
jgi:hypothetical protein